MFCKLSSFWRKSLYIGDLEQMGQRRDRLDKRLARAKTTRQKNSMKKTLEQGRRSEQMIEIVKAGNPPYTAGVMSWLSSQLGKKASQITSEDIAAIVK